MGEYEPDDSRDVTLSNATAPGEPERTGPREDEARRTAEEQRKHLPTPTESGEEEHRTDV